MKVAVLGATGQTGTVIVDALLRASAPQFHVVALIRRSSLQKPEVLNLKNKGVQVEPVDVTGPEDELVKSLVGIDTFISAIYGGDVKAEIPFINASKMAGVMRYVPCFFATVTPPTGVLLLRDMKEDVLNYIKKIKLPYTAIDVGWWHQVNLPRLPSGRIDHAAMGSGDILIGNGDVPFASTHLSDVGKYVVRIIADTRTLNRMVLAHGDVVTFNQIYDIMEKLSGEKLVRNYVTAEQLEATIARRLKMNPDTESMDWVDLCLVQYWYSCGIRGDNTPEYAKYLGYLIAEELYPDFKAVSFEDYAQQALEGKEEKAYKHRPIFLPESIVSFV
ncbi:isoflavone reductase family protein [Paramyrothecium foliicola]|nr:isoflavone reductase family protein [Paramyrothecium foliicola]